jgi:hypothetical protein
VLILTDSTANTINVEAHVVSALNTHDAHELRSGHAAHCKCSPSQTGNPPLEWVKFGTLVRWQVQAWCSHAIKMMPAAHQRAAVQLFLASMWRKLLYQSCAETSNRQIQATGQCKQAHFLAQISQGRRSLMFQASHRLSLCKYFPYVKVAPASCCNAHRRPPRVQLPRQALKHVPVGTSTCRAEMHLAMRVQAKNNARERRV